MGVYEFNTLEIWGGGGRGMNNNKFKKLGVGVGEIWVLFLGTGH